MGTENKFGLALSALIAIAGVGLIVASFATDHWVSCDPESKNSSTNSSRLQGHITFGLFSGYRLFNYGMGPRESNIIIKCDTSESACAYVDDDDSKKSYDKFFFGFDEMIQGYKNRTHGDSLEQYGLFSLSLYAVTLIMLIMAMIWGLVAIGFGVFNVFGRPIETMTGPAGLFLWNFLALVFTLIGIAVYLALFFTEYQENLFSVQIQGAGFTSKDLSELDYSFYFVVGAAVAFVFNMVQLAISGQKCSCSYGRQGEKEVDNGIILY